MRSQVCKCSHVKTRHSGAGCHVCPNMGSVCGCIRFRKRTPKKRSR